MILRRRVSLALVVLGALLVPALSACSFVEQAVNQSVQDVVKEATGGDVELTDGVPSGFPEDAVPLVEGEVRGATQTSGSSTHWVVVVSGDVSADAAEQTLTDAGFTVQSEMAQADLGSMTTLTSDGYTVTVVGASSSVLYTVTPRS